MFQKPVEDSAAQVVYADKKKAAVLLIFIGVAIALVDPFLGWQVSTALRGYLAVIHGVSLLAVLPLVLYGRVGIAVCIASIFTLLIFGLHFYYSGELFHLAVLVVIPIIITVLCGSRLGLIGLFVVLACIMGLCVSLQVTGWTPKYSENYLRSWTKEGLVICSLAIATSLPVIWLSRTAKNTRDLQLETKNRLQTQQERFSSVTRAAYQLIFEADLDWNVFSCVGDFGNELVLEEGNSLVGLNFKNLLQAEDQEQLGQYKSILESENRLIDGEFRLVQKHGAKRWIRVTGGTYHQNGRRIWICGIQFLDRVNSAELRSVDVSKLESLSELSGGLAHDFNNLLTVIGVYAEMLEDSEISRGILNAQDEAANLVQSLMSFAQRQDTQIETLDLNELVRSMKTVIRGLIRDDIEVIWKVQKTPAYVDIDVLQLKQSIINVVNNAKDSMPNGGQLEISTFNLASDDTRGRLGVPSVSIMFSDSGFGMTSEQVDRAFEPFFTTKDRADGTGLGLSMVLGVLRKVGGEVNLISREGYGTDVEFQIPIVDPVALKDIKSDSQQTDQSSNGEQIMLVEDRELLRGAIRSNLESVGYEVVSFGNGRSAWEFFESTDMPIDLIVTDVLLPGIRGLELIKRIRSTGSSIPVIYITGYSEDLGEAVQDPNSTLLAKPFKPEALYREIAQLLKPKSPFEQL